LKLRVFQPVRDAASLAETPRRTVGDPAASGYIARMGSIGPWEIVLLLLLALLLFGAKRLPEIGRSLGSGMREFKDSVSGMTKHDEPAELPRATETPTTTAPREHDTV
jgi:sec-independent protein translocase protein TatA